MSSAGPRLSRGRAIAFSVAYTALLGFGMNRLVVALSPSAQEFANAR